MVRGASTSKTNVKWACEMQKLTSSRMVATFWTCFSDGSKDHSPSYWNADASQLQVSFGVSFLAQSMQAMD